MSSSTLMSTTLRNVYICLCLNNCSHSCTTSALARAALCNLLGMLCLVSWSAILILVSWASLQPCTLYANSSPSVCLHLGILCYCPLSKTNALIYSNSCFVVACASFSIFIASLVLQRRSSMLIIPCNVERNISIHNTPCTCQNSRKSVQHVTYNHHYNICLCTLPNSPIITWPIIKYWRIPMETIGNIQT